MQYSSSILGVPSTLVDTLVEWVAMIGIYSLLFIGMNKSHIQTITRIIQSRWRANGKLIKCLRLGQSLNMSLVKVY